MSKQPSRLVINPPLGKPPVLEWLAPSEMRIDEAYQRSLAAESSQALIRRIAAKWDWRRCQPVNIARRADGSLWVVDGQHRHAAAIMRGDIPHLPCVVVDYADLADEASAFVALNRERRALNSVDVFKAQLAAGDAQAVAVNDIITSAGLTIAPHCNYNTWRPGMLYCVPGIVAAYRTHGKVVTSAALVAMAEAYQGKVLKLAGQMLRGLFRFYALKMRDPSFDPDAFIERLAANSQEQWMRKAADHVARHGTNNIVALGNVFAEAYDRLSEAA